MNYKTNRNKEKRRRWIEEQRTDITSISCLYWEQRMQQPFKACHLSPIQFLLKYQRQSWKRSYYKNVGLPMRFLLTRESYNHLFLMSLIKGGNTLYYSIRAFERLPIGRSMPQLFCYPLLKRRFFHSRIKQCLPVCFH